MSDYYTCILEGNGKEKLQRSEVKRENESDHSIASSEYAVRPISNGVLRPYTTNQCTKKTAFSFFSFLSLFFLGQQHVSSATYARRKALQSRYWNISRYVCALAVCTFFSHGYNFNKKGAHCLAMEATSITFQIQTSTYLTVCTSYRNRRLRWLRGSSRLPPSTTLSSTFLRVVRVKIWHVVGWQSRVDSRFKSGLNKQISSSPSLTSSGVFPTDFN